MKTAKLIILTAILLTINLSLIGQTTQISGTINSDTIWNSDTVQVIGNVTIPFGLKLTIDPGVTVQFQDYYRLNVNGSLFAIGSETDSILFTVADTSGFYSNYDSIDGSWDGIHIIGEENSLDTSIFNYCTLEFGKNLDTILGNANGGVLYVYNYGTLEINNCLIKNNSSNGYSSRGGAFFCKETESILINNNKFLNNFSNYYGGAISIDKICKNTVISNNNFIENTGNVGAAIHSSDLVYGHTIANNYCFNNYNASNGVIYTSNPYGWIYNNVICNNDGTGIVDGHQMSTTKIFGNTIVNNIVGFYSGAIRLFSKAYVYNNICWGNINESGNIHDQIFVSDMSYPHLDNNCVEYGDGGQNSVYEYPDFTDPSAGIGPQYNGEFADWSLLNESPCINTGTEDTTSLNIPIYDITGNVRIFGNRIDIGAIENQVVYVNTDVLKDNSEIQIFPNPGKYSINISSDEIHNNMSIELYNLHGEKVLHSIVSTQISLINTTYLPAGLYLYKIISKDEVLKKGIWVKINE